MKQAQIIMMAVKKSSQVTDAGYDAATKTLAVRFSSGGTYHYHDVPKESFDKLMKADSFGKHLQSNIVGKYSHKKL